MLAYFAVYVFKIGCSRVHEKVLTPSAYFLVIVMVVMTNLHQKGVLFHLC
jgi:hypothetical protein